MQAEKTVPWVIGAVVLATIAAGVWSVGGPASAKQEKRDKVRMSDIQKLNGHVLCLAYATDRTLPDMLPSEEKTIEDCSPVPRLEDPFTEAAYSYERLSDTGFRICGEFEKPELIAYPASYDPETGCVGFQFNP